MPRKSPTVRQAEREQRQQVEQQAREQAAADRIVAALTPLNCCQRRRVFAYIADRATDPCDGFMRARQSAQRRKAAK